MWLRWLTVRMGNAETEIAVNTANDKNVSDEIKSVKKDLGFKIDKVEKHLNDRIERLDDKFDEKFDMVLLKISEIR